MRSNKETRLSNMTDQARGKTKKCKAKSGRKKTGKRAEKREGNTEETH